MVYEALTSLSPVAVTAGYEGMVAGREFKQLQVGILHSLCEASAVLLVERRGAVG